MHSIWKSSWRVQYVFANFWEGGYTYTSFGVLLHFHWHILWKFWIEGPLLFPLTFQVGKFYFWAIVFFHRWHIWHKVDCLKTDLSKLWVFKKCPSVFVFPKKTWKKFKGVSDSKRGLCRVMVVIFLRVFLPEIKHELI